MSIFRRDPFNTSSPDLSPPPTESDQQPTRRYGKWPRIIAKTGIILSITGSIDTYAQLDVPSHIEVVSAAGECSNDTAGIFVPGVTRYVTEEELLGASGLMSAIRHRTSEVTAVNYEGGALDMKTIEAELSDLIRQKLSSHEKVVIHTSSFGSFAAIHALIASDLTDEEKSRITLILEDPPSDGDTIKPSANKIFQIWHPGPMADIPLSYVMPGSPAEDSTFNGHYSFSQFGDQIDIIGHGIPDDAKTELDGIRTIYIQSAPEKDRTVVQPQARLDWLAALPAGVEVVIAQADHTDYYGDPTSVNGVLDSATDTCSAASDDEQHERQDVPSCIKPSRISDTTIYRLC